MANIQFHEDDADYDGRIDSLTLEADVPLSGDEEVKSVQAALFFDFRLRKRVKLDMESLAYASSESGLPMSGLDSRGALTLQQARPLGVRDYASELYAEETPLVNVLDSPSANQVTDSKIGRILEKYRERDVAADYVERYPVISRAAPEKAVGSAS